MIKLVRYTVSKQFEMFKYSLKTDHISASLDLFHTMETLYLSNLSFNFCYNEI